jgi:glycerophosphoryl diester phosphodiesterase
MIQKQLMFFNIVFIMDFYTKLKKRHLVAAHRGYRSVRPENTLSSFEAAVGHFDLIELDVQPSRDGRLMVLHDDTLERTTNIEELSRLPRPHHLSDYDYETLRSLDSGSWFAGADPFGSIANGQTNARLITPQQIPALREVLELCTSSSMPLNIEIKDTPTYDADLLLSEISSVISPYLHQIPVLISSFNHRYLKRLHEMDPDLSLAANVEYLHPPDLIEYLLDLGVCGYHVDAPMAETTPVAKLAKNNIKCGVFTVNSEMDKKRYFDLGFHLIFSDLSCR